MAKADNNGAPYSRGVPVQMTYSGGKPSSRGKTRAGTQSRSLKKKIRDAKG